MDKLVEFIEGLVPRMMLLPLVLCIAFGCATQPTTAKAIIVAMLLYLAIYCSGQIVASIANMLFTVSVSTAEAYSRIIWWGATLVILYFYDSQIGHVLF